MYINHCTKKQKTYKMLYIHKNEVNSINNFKNYTNQSLISFSIFVEHNFIYEILLLHNYFICFHSIY